MKKFIFVSFLLLFFTSGYAKTINDAQIIPHESSIYDEFQQLQNSAKQLVFTQNTPISVGELKFYLKQFDYDSLSPAAQKIYDSLYDFLYTRENILNFEDFELTLHPQINLELYYKSNKDIPWTFNYYYKDNLITMPLDLGFGNNLAMGSNLFLGNSYFAAQNNDNFWNVPVNLKNLPDTYKSIEFYFPSFAYAGFGKYYDNWGYNLYIAKQGKTIGNTLTGSIIYNSTFETDAYVEFDVYTKVLKFTMDVVQISSNRMDNIQMDNTERYLYYHQFDIRVLKNLKFSIMEGSLIASPFSLRFLNPLPFMHQYGDWKNYITKENEDLYKMLLSSDLYFKFLNQIKGILIDFLSNDKRFNNLDERKNYRESQIDLIANGIIYLYVDYFKGFLHVNLDELLELVELYLKKII